MKPDVPEIAPGKCSLWYLGLWSLTKHPGSRQDLECCFSKCPFCLQHSSPLHITLLAVVQVRDCAQKTLWARVSCARPMSDNHSWKTDQTLLLFTEICTSSKPVCATLQILSELFLLFLYSKILLN